jgi:putative nucleotidyltransferase with HDIG domain
MLIEEARNLVAAHLGSSKRAEHSVFVGYVMRSLAERLGADITIWEVVGLLHDLDFFNTADDRRQHGILTANWLANYLPPDALDAIRAHDHRTAIQANTAIADALKLADALAIADEMAGRETIVDLLNVGDKERLRSVLASRSYLAKMIVEYSQRLRLPLSELAIIYRNAPPQ